LVDKTLVLRKVAELERYLEQVREFAEITLAAYKSDWRRSVLWNGLSR
jgi:hypothetical protein